MAAPDILRLNPAMTPLQMGTGIATFGTGAQAGAHRGDAAQEFFKNVVARRLLTPEGTVQPGEYHDLVRPIEEQYMRDVLGLSFEPGNIGSVLSALGVAPTGGQVQRQATQRAPGASGVRGGDRFGANLDRARGEAGSGGFDLGLDAARDPSDVPADHVPRGELGDPAIGEIFDDVAFAIGEELEDIDAEDIGSTLGNLAPIPGAGILGSLVGRLIDTATAPGEDTRFEGLTDEERQALRLKAVSPTAPTSTSRDGGDRQGAPPEAAAAANIGAGIGADLAGAALGVGASKSSKSSSKSSNSSSRSSGDRGRDSSSGDRGSGPDAGASDGDPSGGFSSPFARGGMVTEDTGYPAPKDAHPDDRKVGMEGGGAATLQTGEHIMPKIVVDYIGPEAAEHIRVNARPGADINKVFQHAARLAEAHAKNRGTKGAVSGRNGAEDALGGVRLDPQNVHAMGGEPVLQLLEVSARLNPANPAAAFNEMAWRRVGKYGASGGYQDIPGYAGGGQVPIGGMALPN